MRPHLSDKDKEDLIAEMQVLVGPDIKLMAILATNYKPHPYVVGTEHVDYARKHYGHELLSEQLIREFENRGGHCAARGCQVPYDEHHFELGMSVQLQRNLSSSEANTLFGKIKPMLIANNIKGMMAVPNEFGYGILSSPKKGKR